MKKLTFALLTTLSCAAFARPAPLVSIPSHDAFFDSIKAHCGKAYEGKVTVDNQGPSSFSDARLVMHVRKCSDTELQVPFHVGKDASRTWIITKTGSGLSLKHDHRHEDGSDDVSTMYGGHTLDAGYNTVQSFPADEYSKQLFIQQGIPQSVGNTWQMYIYPEQFTYRLVREGREFRVDFDLTKPVTAPKAPWGYKD
ncbi:hypothetical protein HUZ36_11715 [Pseudoalteromonas sp. McH1-7]|uniref:Secreted protein n=1 Tax=Pseudoalteromonas peptidolytica F12-50-A1 TaxID=1315280 RepID=A0A8I0MZK7_9GAMM|nr:MULTISPECIES: hypothetical protein [Pseudoalteromonas]MBE0348025.1 hypothetical protein [Pseudoalteromonas peptidolytica F12-50-A1]MDW7550777.1 hypothetical protein [Pseudoalteromonas peptidolytica]NLR16932.1 hypothetical protein [Pseudoalteromonas peptidolytica]NUZ11444.1 hypothetical protein [Pseudoalteromonas sp. McH1-7]RRS09697.1 hypothetical protein EAG18_05145 [Pseudoalteromonas sp. J010]